MACRVYRAERVCRVARSARMLGSHRKPQQISLSRQPGGFARRRLGMSSGKTGYGRLGGLWPCYQQQCRRKLASRLPKLQWVLAPSEAS